MTISVRSNADSTADILTQGIPAIHIDAAGTVAFPQNKVSAFNAKATGGQALGGGVGVVINLGTVVFDTDNFFTPSPNKFMPTVAGYYQLNASLSITGTVVSVTGVQIRKNGVTEAGAQVNPTTSATQQALSCSALLYLNGTTDYVEMAGVAVGTGTVVSISSYPTEFSGCLVRAA